MGAYICVYVYAHGRAHVRTCIFMNMRACIHMMHVPTCIRMGHGCMDIHCIYICVPVF